MAAVTFHAEGPGKAANRPAFWNAPRPIRVVTGTFAFDSSYPTGGESISDITDKFTETLGVFFMSKSGYVFSTDITNKKVLAYYSDYDAVADGALIQVPNTTDLSAVTGVTFLAFGYGGAGAVS